MNTAVLEKVFNCPTLPSLPSIAIEVLELTADDSVPVAKIAKVIQNDQALAAKILKTINSSFYGLAKPCPTISRAVAYLGMNTVKSLALGFSVIDLQAEGGGAFDPMAHWRRCVYGGAGARIIGEYLVSRDAASGPEVDGDPEEMFIAALLQDVGVLAMFTALGEEYDDVIAGAGRDHDRLAALEQAAFGVDHAEVGALLGEKWRLPTSLAELIRYHHRTDTVPEAYQTVVRVVTLANLATAALLGGEREAAIAQFRRRGREWFNLDKAEAETLIDTITAGGKELARMFMGSHATAPSVASIRARASEALVEHQIKVERETTELRRSNDELARQTVTDTLTGASNRKHFDAIIAEAFEASRADGAVAVIFGDADKFKSVNDTYGHQAGDVVLVELAARLMATVGDRGTVCRYGGEEFATVVPNADRVKATRLAEQMRLAVGERPVDVSGVDCGVPSLAVTVSLGVAALDDSTRSRITRADQLVRAADQAVYAAKQAGRNCVRALCFRTPAASAAATAPSSPAPTTADPAPVAAGASPPLTLVPAPAPPTPTSDGAASRFCVLLVEGDAMHASLMTSALCTVPDVTVEVATSGAAAVDRLNGGVWIDLILCDRGLPDLTGDELVRQVRGLASGRTVPIVMISSMQDAEGIDRCLAAGANAYMTKQAISADPGRTLQHIVEFWRHAARVA